MATQRPASKAAAAAAAAARRPQQEERPRRWQHDIEAVVCAACHAPFTTLRRKHHCRSCGRILCGQCSVKRLLVPVDAMVRPRRGQPAAALAPLDLDPRTPQRVCPPCAEGLLACQEELRRTVSRASQRHLLSRRSLDRYLNAPLSFDMETQIKKAAYTLYNFTADSLEGQDALPRELIWGAQGLAFLTMVKAGMFLTARLGSGLVVGRLPDGDADGDGGGGGGGDNGRGDDTPSQQRRRRAKQRGLPRWSAPSAITCSGVGYGFQMGAELIDVVIVLNAAALEAFASSTQLAVGTELSISLGPLGRTAATDLHAGVGRGVVGAAFAYGQSKGLFLGVSLEGTVILSRPAVNRAFYGTPHSTHQLLLGQVPPPRAAEPLYQALDEILSGDSGSGMPGSNASLGADFADSTWHGFLARHTRHRRHHSRRRSAEAAAAAAMAAVTAAAEAEAAAVGVGGGEEVCCGRMGEGPAEIGRAPWQVEGNAAAAAPDDDGWAAERARRLQQSREKEEEEDDDDVEVEVEVEEEEGAEEERRELRTFKTTAVFGADKRAEEAAGRVGAGPGHKA